LTSDVAPSKHVFKSVLPVWTSRDWKASAGDGSGGCVGGTLASGLAFFLISQL
jgi:hypothetical protein